MATLSGITAEEAERIHKASIVTGRIDSSGQLILTTRGGIDINAGVIAPQVKLDQVYPVGAIYMSTSSLNPSHSSQLGGGTWVAWGQGRVPLGVDASNANFNAAEKTGGVYEVKLTAAQSGVKSHTHAHTLAVGSTQLRPKFNGEYESSSNVDTPATIRRGFGAPDNAGNLNRWLVDSDHTHTLTGTITPVASVNADEAHTNMQPYITCYMWKRTG